MQELIINVPYRVPSCATRFVVQSGPRVRSVGLGQAIVGEVGDILLVPGLGSCIALALWSRRLRVGALCHIVLPHSCNRPFDPTRPAWYVDWAVTWAVEALARCGARPPELVAKGAGGANVLTTSGLSDIGASNTQAVLSALRVVGVPVAAFHIGGMHSRTVRFDPATGTLEVRITGGQTQLL